MNLKLASALVCSCASWAPCWAQTAPAAVPTSALNPAVVTSAPGQVLQVEERVDQKEPNVKHTVTEDSGSKIDELVVRGQVQHVVVTPKVGVTKPYEIIVQRGGREQVDGAGGTSGAIGKRVWNILAF